MLTDTAIRNAKPKDKPYRLSDALGLYIEIAASGGKLWRLKYRFGGKEKRLALGVYGDVSLQDARKQREAARKILSRRGRPWGRPQGAKDGGNGCGHFRDHRPRMVRQAQGELGRRSCR